MERPNLSQNKRVEKPACVRGGVLKKRSNGVRREHKRANIFMPQAKRRDAVDTD